MRNCEPQVTFWLMSHNMMMEKYLGRPNDDSMYEHAHTMIRIVVIKLIFLTQKSLQKV